MKLDRFVRVFLNLAEQGMNSNTPQAELYKDMHPEAERNLQNLKRQNEIRRRNRLMQEAAERRQAQSQMVAVKEEKTSSQSGGGTGAALAGGLALALIGYGAKKIFEKKNDTQKA